MKKVNIKIAGLALLAFVGFTSCSTDFLEEKIDYEHADPELYNDYAGALARVADCYARALPNPGGNPGWQYNSTGKADDWSKCTEEYAGFGIWVDPNKNLTTASGLPDYFQGDKSNIQNNPWGLIRNINDTILGIEGSTLAQEQKDELLGQCHFLRAWRYWILVQWFGGVPIIKDLPPFVAESVTPRSSAKECIQFIIDELDLAADLLQNATGSGQWMSGDNYGRVTTGTALALKGRVLTWWCSPLFNRSQDTERYAAAYAEMVEDLTRIEACGYGLYKGDNAGNTMKHWANMFQLPFDTDAKKEAVFFARFNSVAPGGRPDFARNNGWEQHIRPKNAYGGGGTAPSAMIVDLFPMRDGKLPDNSRYTKLPAAQAGDAYEYDPQHPFVNRDMRFYRTFGFPGIVWPHQGSNVKNNTNYPYESGSEYELWNYVWYLNADDVESATSSNAYGADGLLKTVKGIYVTKRSTGDAYAYSFANADKGLDHDGYSLSYASYLELRFAEVLLNLAEVACGANELAAAEGYLQKIRTRAGYTADTNYGLPTGMDQGTLFGAILYERQIELAFEGKRFDDMRRWLLFDGGVNFNQIPGAPASWSLSGWGGNTCEYVGYKPLNGERRENMEFQVKPSIENGIGGDDWAQYTKTNGEEDIEANPDPIFKYIYKKVSAAVKTAQGAEIDKTDDDMAEAEWATLFDEGDETLNAILLNIMKKVKIGKTPAKSYWESYKEWRKGYRMKLNDMKYGGNIGKNQELENEAKDLRDNFYKPFLQRKMKRGDGRNSDNTVTGMVVTYQPRYYLIGLNSGALGANPTLEQTIGWENTEKGNANGTFDPLAE